MELCQHIHPMVHAKNEGGGHQLLQSISLLLLSVTLESTVLSITMGSSNKGMDGYQQ